MGLYFTRVKVVGAKLTGWWWVGSRGIIFRLGGGEWDYILARWGVDEAIFWLDGTEW